MADKTLVARLIEARRKMTDPKLSGKNPHFGSKFVPLDEVLTACVAPCLDAGVFLSQGVMGDTLVTTAHGDEGSVILGEYPVPPNTDPQKYMGAVTYAARKSLMLAFGFRGDEDDDGTIAAAPPAQKPACTSTQAERIKTLVTEHGHSDAVKKQLAEWGVPFTVNGLNALSADAFQQLRVIAAMGAPDEEVPHGDDAA